MEKLKLSQIAAACGGELNTETQINSVCIDTRKITKGCLFICIKGDRFDAHDFIGEAYEKGAAAVMIDRDIVPNGAYVKVCSTKKALLDLASYYRSMFNIPVVALTGSVGKTTTKEFTSLVVGAKYKTVKTQGNLNNEIGMPQTIFQIDSSAEAAVIEMGMNHFGEIERLSAAAKPDIAVITNIGVSHIENLGSRDGILKAKLEITTGLKKGGALVLNADNDKLSTVNSDEYKIYRFGIENGDFKAVNICESEDSVSFDVEYFGKKEHIFVPAVGVHNVYNALAAFAVGFLLDVEPSAAAHALALYVPQGMRQKIVKTVGITSIEDCYNASPDSMSAALRTLNGMKGGAKIAVLGDMLELGEYSKTAHIGVGKAAAENNVDFLLAYGKDACYYVSEAKKRGCQNAFWFDSKQALSEKLCKIIKKGDVVLFKASRGMKMEDVINSVYKELEK